ncbi:Altered inheritance of mitochondria protein 6 [Cadophora gregata]|uniref:Altered inheritance of mitochondria protein 6 n=1 Tax=Cadophora gregata TaxID=51156 RepID=UPI0026DDA8CE|nr:Altered inheritance of mitochondria protein 6 [Cadophora gregata]KAK0123747.1 Altered inheritance of mitochondria protein 6 [Cadophora gregata]
MAPADFVPTLINQRQHHHHQRQQLLHHDEVVSEHAERPTPSSTPTPAPTPTLVLSPSRQDRYHDGASTSSASSPRKSHASLDTEPEYETDPDNELLDLENGYLPGINTDTNGGRDWSGDKDRSGRGWWGFKDIMTMTVRERRKESLDSTRSGSSYRDEGKALLIGGSYSCSSTRWRRRRGWLNYFVFGGISGLSIIAILLATNLLLTILTLYAHPPDPDDVFVHWGSLNTGTSDLSWYPTDFTRDIQPVPCHSHNDYWRRVPLFSALRHGCTGVEADVWLTNNDLLVGHNRASLSRNRTFTTLYVDPLVKILEHQNPHTRFYNGTNNGVFDVDPEQTVTLLIDVKTGGKETWPWVLKQLEPLRERGWLTYMEGDVLHRRAVTVVGTGNTRFDVLTANETYRDAFFDAPLDTMWEPPFSTTASPLSNSPQSAKLDVDDPSSSEASPPQPPPLSQGQDLGQGLSGTTPTSSFTSLNSHYASVSLRKSIGIIWRGRLSPEQLDIIRGQVRGAHKRGLKARYWDLPAWPLGLRDYIWGVLVREGVDVLNVDDLRAVRGVWRS